MRQGLASRGLGCRAQDFRPTDFLAQVGGDSNVAEGDSRCRTLGRGRRVELEREEARATKLNHSLGVEWVRGDVGERQGGCGSGLRVGGDVVWAEHVDEGVDAATLGDRGAALVIGREPREHFCARTLLGGVSVAQHRTEFADHAAALDSKEASGERCHLEEQRTRIDFYLRLDPLGFQFGHDIQTLLLKHVQGLQFNTQHRVSCDASHKICLLWS
jgi:hypothetical protein